MAGTKDYAELMQLLAALENNYDAVSTVETRFTKRCLGLKL